MAETRAVKLTKRVVDALPFADEGQVLYRDAEQAGFALLVGRTSKTYVAEKRVRGRTVRSTIGRADVLTAEEARKQAITLLARMTLGVNVNAERRAVPPAAITLQRVYDDYFRSRTLRETTRRDYLRALTKDFGDWRSKPITTITRDMIERRFDELSLRSHALANRSFRGLRAWFNYAVEKYEDANGEPLVPSNPCARLKALKKWHRIPHRTRYIHPMHLRQFWDALLPLANDPAHTRAVKDLCVLLLLTGLREQEGASLTWSNIDLQKRELLVLHTKAHRAHALPVGEWLTGMLARRHGETGLSPFVFPAPNQTGHLKHHRKCVLALCEQSGVEFRLHDLRRTFASIVNRHLGHTLSVYTIKRLLNHSTDGDVTAGYVQHSVEDLRPAMEEIERFVLECVGRKPVPSNARRRTPVRRTLAPRRVPAAGSVAGGAQIDSKSKL